MTKVFEQIPSTAIDRIVVDSEKNQVQIVYKSSDKTYTYSAENVVDFEQQLLAEYDNEDPSFGRLVNQNVSNGSLQILTEQTTVA